MLQPQMLIVFIINLKAMTKIKLCSNSGNTKTTTQEKKTQEINFTVIHHIFIYKDMITLQIKFFVGKAFVIEEFIDHCYRHTCKLVLPLYNVDNFDCII